MLAQRSPVHSPEITSDMTLQMTSRSTLQSTSDFASDDSSHQLSPEGTPQAPREAIKVLYIGGYGRSGSTLLNQLLGQIDGFHSVGEMWNVWQRCFIENQLCSCGVPFRNCEFWSAVVEQAFGGFEHVPLDEINRLVRLMRSNQYLLPLAYPRLRSAEQQANIDAYVAILRKLYRSIQQVSGSRVIVDASKGPRYAMLLSEIDEIELRVVHLVRDSRGVVYSWQKTRIKPEVYWKTEYMDRLNPTSAALIWNITNLFMQTFRKREANYLFVRYEDLVTSPRVWLKRIVEFAGEEGYDEIPIEGDGTLSYAVNVAVDHSAGGNPSRFRQGMITLRQDTEWQEKMPEYQKFVVTTLTRPLLRRYGYSPMIPAGELRNTPVDGRGAFSGNGRSI
jgi:hypothetical protein